MYGCCVYSLFLLLPFSIIQLIKNSNSFTFSTFWSFSLPSSAFTLRLPVNLSYVEPKCTLHTSFIPSLCHLSVSSYRLLLKRNSVPSPQRPNHLFAHLIKSCLTSSIPTQLPLLSLPLSPLPVPQFIATSDREIYSQNTFLASLSLYHPPQLILLHFFFLSTTRKLAKTVVPLVVPRIKIICCFVVVSIRIWPHRIAWPPASIPDP